MGQNLRAAADQNDPMSARLLHGPPMPPEGAHVWLAFSRLRARTGGGMGPNPIGWSDIDAFVRLTATPLAPWEVECIEHLDQTWMRVVTDKNYEWRPEGDDDGD